VYSLEALGVDVVFGIPGGAILPAYDPLYDSTSVRHVLFRTSRAPGNAAEAVTHMRWSGRRVHRDSGRAHHLVTPIAGRLCGFGADGGLSPARSRPQIGSDPSRKRYLRHYVADNETHFLVQSADDIPRTDGGGISFASTAGRSVLVDIPKECSRRRPRSPGRRRSDCPATAGASPHGKQFARRPADCAVEQPVLYIGGAS